jgi:hypothetical protein
MSSLTNWVQSDTGWSNFSGFSFTAVTHTVSNHHVCVYVCTYVCMYVCMYVCVFICVCMYVCVFIYVCVYVYLYMYVCVYVCIYVLCVYVFMYVFVCMYVCVCTAYVACMCVCMYVCMYVCHELGIHSLAAYSRGPVSIAAPSAWDFWRTKWHWNILLFRGTSDLLIYFPSTKIIIYLYYFCQKEKWAKHLNLQTNQCCFIFG